MTSKRPSKFYSRDTVLNYLVHEEKYNRPHSASGVHRKNATVSIRHRAKSTTLNVEESKAGGKLMGRGRLVDCFFVPKKDFQKNYRKHRVRSLKQVPYASIYAWVIEKAEKFDTSFDYEHKQGAVYLG